MQIDPSLCDCDDGVADLHTHPRSDPIAPLYINIRCASIQLAPNAIVAFHGTGLRQPEEKNAE